MIQARASAENFPGVFQGEKRQRRKDRKIAKKKTPKNSTFKPLSTIFVPCMKIRGAGTAPLPPSADAHGFKTTGQKKLLNLFYKRSGSL